MSMKYCRRSISCCTPTRNDSCQVYRLNLSFYLAGERVIHISLVETANTKWFGRFKTASNSSSGTISSLRKEENFLDDEINQWFQISKSS